MYAEIKLAQPTLKKLHGNVRGVRALFNLCLYLMKRFPKMEISFLSSVIIGMDIVRLLRCSVPPSKGTFESKTHVRSRLLP